MTLVGKPCPVHGTTNVALIMADNDGTESAAMTTCLACVQDGASPLGAWSEVISTEDVYSCKKCGAMVWDVALHDNFHEVPAGRRVGYQSRYLHVAMVPNLLAPPPPKEG